MKPDFDEATRFLAMLGTRHTFQTFDDGHCKRPGLACILHGTLTEHVAALADANACGAGVFVCVNETDGKGRKATNVRAVRAVFVDLDGAPLEPVTSGPLAPHCTVESSPGRFHAYWRLADCPLSDFTLLQQELAARFASDPKVCDLPRVMRIPGFDHRKAAPFRSSILSYRDAVPYTVAQVRAAFGFGAAPNSVVKLPTNRGPRRAESLARARGRAAQLARDEATATPCERRIVPDTIPAGERNATLFSAACGFVKRGYELDAVKQRLQRLNADRCRPQLCTAEVDAIAARAVGYGSDGFVLLPHDLLDSPQWKAKPPAVHEVVLMAFRRWDGTEAGFALTWEDFEGREGFSSKDTFLRHRRAATDAGFLVRIAEARSSQTGRKPDLFTIAHRWRRFARSENQTLRKVWKSDPYIDKHLRGALEVLPCAGGSKHVIPRDAA